MAPIPDRMRAGYDNCRFCLFSRRWGSDEGGVVWACVLALNEEIDDVTKCGGTDYFTLRPGREEDFANRLERSSIDRTSREVSDR